MTTARSTHLLICRFQAELKLSFTCGRPIFLQVGGRLVVGGTDVGDAVPAVSGGRSSSAC